MPRRLRYIPEGGALVEVTCRTIHGRFLLKPCRTLNDAIVGTLARAKRRYGVHICAAAVLSNHYHLLLRVHDARQLARFMGFVNTKIAKEVGRAWRWRDKIWARRYQAIVVSQEEAAQVARLSYLLSHGVKEGLVTRCTDWPGVHCAQALATGHALVGYWFDRTKQYRARLRKKTLAFEGYATRETLAFDPLPCWRHLSRSKYQHRIRSIVVSIEGDAAKDRTRSERASLGRHMIRQQQPHDQPALHRRTQAPAFHAATKPARLLLAEGYRWFVQTYRKAATQLRAGANSPRFPRGCFPPALPFVETSS